MIEDMSATSSIHWRNIGNIGRSDSKCDTAAMISPVFYIEVSMVFASLALTIIFFIAWKTLGDRPYMLSWSVAFLAATCQWFLHLIAEFFPHFDVYWLAVNGLAMILITLGIRGHCQRTDYPHLPQNLWPYSVVLYAIIVWTTIVSPHTGVRMMVVPTSACAALLLSAVIIIRHREQPRPAEWAAAISMVIFGITQGIAAGMAAMQGTAGDPAYLNLYLHFNFLTLPAGFMTMGMFVILMCASDLSEQMKRIAVRDQLTGLLNRRGLGEQGAAAFATSRRTGSPVSVIMTDIDRFKSINDKFGHSLGDDALVHFANLLLELRRVNDVIARVGGEEFAIVLQNTDLKNAMRIADSLCAKTASSSMSVGGEKLLMTASFGVATISDSDSCLSDIIVRADKALYGSKRAGRNQISLESSQMMLTLDGELEALSG